MFVSINALLIIMIVWITTGVWLGFKHLENSSRHIDINIKDCIIILISGISGPFVCLGVFIIKCGDKWEYFKWNLDKYKDRGVNGDKLHNIIKN